MAAGGPPQGTPPGAAGRGCLALLVAPAAAPALVMAGDGGAPPCPAPHLADNGWLPALDAAARDAPLPGLAAAAPAAAAPPGAPALDHGNQPEESGGARAVRFGKHAANEDDDDDEWGYRGGDDPPGPIFHGTRPIGVENDFGFSGGGSTGWGGGGPAAMVYGRLDGSGPCPSGGRGGWGVSGGFPPLAATGPPVRRTQRWAVGTQKRSASADVRVLDAQRANAGPARGGPTAPPGGTPSQGDWIGFSTVLDPLVVPSPTPAPLFDGAHLGQGAPGFAGGRATGPPSAPVSYSGTLPKGDYV